MRNCCNPTALGGVLGSKGLDATGAGTIVGGSMPLDGERFVPGGPGRRAEVTGRSERGQERGGERDQDIEW